MTFQEKTSLRLCTPQMVRNSERTRPLEKSKTLVDWVDRIPKNVQTQKQLLKNRLQRENTEIHVHVSGNFSTSTSSIFDKETLYHKLNTELNFSWLSESCRYQLYWFPSRKKWSCLGPELEKTNQTSSLKTTTRNASCFRSQREEPNRGWATVQANHLLVSFGYELV